MGRRYRILSGVGREKVIDVKVIDKTTSLDRQRLNGKECKKKDKAEMASR